MSVSEGGRVFLRPIFIFAIEGTAQSRDVPFSAYSFVARQKSMAECEAATSRLCCQFTYRDTSLKFGKCPLEHAFNQNRRVPARQPGSFLCQAAKKRTKERALLRRAFFAVGVYFR